MAHSITPRHLGPDETFMHRALELARRGEGMVEPNPMVGCVLVRDGAIIAEGFHQRFGGPHAEIEALTSLGQAEARGATAYVSLEPCCHHGKTPPCTEALIQAGIKRVVVAIGDPYAEVNGGGLNRLSQAGIEVTKGVLESEAIAISAPYLKRIRTGKPWTIAKWAITIDGRIATRTGQSQWITGEASRAEVHRLRARVDAIIVGMGTVAADNPMLNARLSQPDTPPPRIAQRIIFCRHRLPDENSKLVVTMGQIPLRLIVGNQLDPRQLDRLRELGAEVTETGTDEPREMVLRALDQFGQLGMTNVMIEGGAELIASFFEAQQLDECHVYIGPRIFGGVAAPGPIGGEGIAQISECPNYRIEKLERFGNDVKVVYRRLDR